MSKACPSCGAHMPLRAKFCGKCGAILTKSPPTKFSVSSPKIIGMQVYDSDCLFVGTVREIGIIPGVGSITLYVSTKASNTVEIKWDDVKTVGDIIQLSKKISQSTAEMAPLCPVCGKLATFIPQYRRYYCYNCKRYLDSLINVATTQVAQQIGPLCSKCGRPGTWIPQYKRYYCYNCKDYI